LWWWLFCSLGACVLGKTGAKVERICLCCILPWFGLTSSYLAMFDIPVIDIERLADVGGLTGVNSLFVDWKWTREDSCCLSQAGPACVVLAKGLSVSLSGYSTAPWLPMSHYSLGGH